MNAISKITGFFYHLHDLQSQLRSLCKFSHAEKKKKEQENLKKGKRKYSYGTPKKIQDLLVELILVLRFFFDK